MLERGVCADTGGVGAGRHLVSMTKESGVSLHRGGSWTHGPWQPALVAAWVEQVMMQALGVEVPVGAGADELSLPLLVV